MSVVEQAFCRSVPWQWFTRRVVFPWAVGGVALEGRVLELGSGAGANAQALLAAYPAARVTATDVDPVMVGAARKRLAPFGDRAAVEEADATALPFPDASFDAVVSLIMLHHVVDWERAVAEVRRVLRPGGLLAGYDLVDSRASRAIHRLDRSPHRMVGVGELRAELGRLGFGAVLVDTSLGGLVARFRACAPS